ncbi:hypothetical protein IV203_011437 [Nitzschia inconspicua]|uniref:Uncharacterized protein n=1 Tax=Nitzschia inconspicua TaxID=303405 RepID=A0A9K3KTB2_9STRA|nr:hypothetical protein IV203_011437 [Nitzschia inconspicua]
MFTNFPLTQSSISLPDCIGDKLLQSHHGKRRYQRRGSRCPSMLLLHVSDVLEETERTVQQNAHAIPQTPYSSPPKQLTSTVTSVECSNFVAEDIPVDADSRRHHDQMAVILLTEALQLSTFDSPDQRPMQTS